MKIFATLWILLLLSLPFNALAAARTGPARTAQAAQAAPQAAPQAATQAAPSQSAPQRMQPDMAFALMAAEAEKGGGGAMLALGRFYEQGVGVARNYTKALEWYEKAAKTGQLEGDYNLGVCYEIGMGVTADAAKAVQHYRNAADKGLALAMYKLSSIYIAGSGVPRDAAMGIGYLEKAADAGLAAAAGDLGAISLSGLLGRQKDEKKALGMFMKAADLGSLEAVKSVAVMHKDGLGTKADPAAAYMWYCVARRGGYAGEDVVRMMGLLEGSLAPAQMQQARKDADAWLARYAERGQGAR